MRNIILAFSRGTTRLNDMPQSSRSLRPVSHRPVSVACQWREKDLSVWWHLKIFLVEAAPGLISGAVVVKVEVPAHVLLISGAVNALVQALLELKSICQSKENISAAASHSLFKILKAIGGNYSHSRNINAAAVTAAVEVEVVTNRVLLPPQIFQGNHNPTDEARSFLPKPTLARYIRIRPLTWEQGICMRFEIYGCRASGSTAVFEARLFEGFTHDEMPSLSHANGRIPI